MQLVDANSNRGSHDAACFLRSPDFPRSCLGLFQSPGGAWNRLSPARSFRLLPSRLPRIWSLKADNDFAVDLYHQLSHNSGNLFFSPYSIATALEMTLQGAKGTTAQEMIQALHLPSSDLAQAGIAAFRQLFQADPMTAGYTLSTANQLWVNQNSRCWIRS